MPGRTPGSPAASAINARTVSHAARDRSPDSSRFRRKYARRIFGMVKTHCACPTGSITSSRKNIPKITPRFAPHDGHRCRVRHEKVSSRSRRHESQRRPAVEVARDGFVGEPSPEPEPRLEAILPLAAEPLVESLREFPQRRGPRIPRTVERGGLHRPRPERHARRRGERGPIASQPARSGWVAAAIAPRRADPRASRSFGVLTRLASNVVRQWRPQGRVAVEVVPLLLRTHDYAFPCRRIVPFDCDEPAAGLERSEASSGSSSPTRRIGPLIVSKASGLLGC